ncbi:hypothetical protein D0C28_10875 [Rhizobium sp. AU243]|nr:hypothetical protein D0C28_10875 [Rhizobium sp. AU243]
MRMAFPRPLALVPVCSEARLRLAAFPAGRAERSEKAEGKIKETGTALARFLKFSLSAHWLGEPRAAPCFGLLRAANLRNALALLGSDRHHSLKSPVFRSFASEALA